MSTLPVAARELVASVPYLAGLSADELERLMSGCEFRTLRRGEVAFRQHEPPPGIVLIVSGRIAVSRVAPDGREQVLHEEGTRATLAEIPVFDGDGCLGTATAVEDSTVVILPRGLLLGTLDRNPAAARAVIRTLATRTRKFAETIEDLSLRNILERLASFLLRAHQREGHTTIQLESTREQLATRLGTVREEVSRALSELKRAGMIDVDGRRVRLLRVERLRALVEE